MNFHLKNNKRIDFIGIGVQKAGTTALHNYLMKHPTIAMPELKELHYFSNPKIDFKQQEDCDYADYHRHFDWNVEKIRGEITPRYCYSNNAIPQIFKYNPQIKLILILRNPIQRAFSHWNMLANNNIITASFLDCIKADILRLKFNTLFEQSPELDFVRRGFYVEQMERIFQYFPSEQVHIIKYEDFKANQQQSINNIFRFLGVEESAYLFEEKHVFQFPYETKIDAASNNMLAELYLPEIEKIETLLNWDCSDWKYGKI